MFTAGLVACNMDDKKPGNVTLSAADKERAASDTSNYTSIAWLDSTSLDLGKVKKGKLVEVAYRFKNSGNKQLIITDVSAGCGCTIPEKPKEPYAPGQDGVIKATFDSKNQHTGPHTKYVTVIANTSPNPTHQLNFSVEITE